jgi:hypothetical protein
MKSLNMQLNRSLDQSVNSVITLLTVSEKRVKSTVYDDDESMCTDRTRRIRKVRVSE